jgi:predicted TIM-barrel fold metal-dependent hydrolase
VVSGSVVDADAHVNEDPFSWNELADLHPGWLSAGKSAGKWVAQIGDKLYPTQEGPGRGVPIDSATNPACAAGAADLDQRLADMDSEGIDVQVLYGGLIIGLTSYDDAGFALDVARAYNDWLLAKVCGHHPERLKGVAVVPLQDVNRSITELTRVARLGAVAVAIPLPGAGRFDNYAQVHCLSFPVDQMVAFTALAMGGVLDRLPALRVAFLESGTGWVPYFVHRMHEHFEKRPELLPAMKTDPRDLLARGQCYFSFEAEEPLLEPCVEQLGDEWLVYASDYPHWDSDFPGTVAEVRRLTAGLGDDVTAKLLGGNASRLYNL